MEDLGGGRGGEGRRKKEGKWLAMFLSIPEIWSAVDKKQREKVFLQHFKHHIWQWLSQFPYNLTE